jgi:hypothetical protein
VIVTVTTLKDRLRNVERFVRGNLAGGVDHMIVFLDAPDAEVEPWLAARPEVTTVVTDKTWWRDQRPQLLNKRQRVNANLARAVLTQADWAEWLFHIDADEIAQIDRTELAGVPRRRHAVGLTPLEVVSEMHPAGEPHLFKPLLEEGDLALLQALGVLAEPSNSLYFRSHIAGKVGVRPRDDVWLGIHKATDRQDKRLPLVRTPGLRMLHLESYSGEEFVRKWTAMVGSGPSMHFGTHRMQVATALKAVVHKDLPSQQRARVFEMIYERHMADPVDLLRDLDLLEEIDPLQGTHSPELLPQDERDRLAGLFEALRGDDKWQFLPDSMVKAKAARAGERPAGTGRADADEAPRRLRDRLRPRR